MGLIPAFLIVLLTVAIAGAAAAGWVAGRAYLLARSGVRAARRMPVIRHVPLIGKNPIPPPNLDADLNAYPERLVALESRLVERHDAVQDQLRLLTERRLALGAKPDRADLVSRYEDDIGHLDRRASSMRRVITLVWRTRAILLLRVYLAVTGRRRPNLGNLPESGPGARLDKLGLARARGQYAEAAASVRFYLDEVRERLDAVPAVVPSPPSAAEVDDALRAAVDEELTRTRDAHADLLARMDRLADNLTWLGDHAGTLSVVDDDVVAPAAGPHGESAAHLLSEVDAAIHKLNELAGAVDHQLAARALDQLDDDVGRLETQGLEEQAAAAAEIEVARLVEGFPA